MSQNSPFDEHAGASNGGMDFSGIPEGHFIFEDKNLVYNDEDNVQDELEVQLGEDSQSDVSATVLWKHVIKGKKCGNAHGGSHVFKCKHCQRIYHGTYTRVYAHLMGHKKGESKGIGYCSVVKADKNLQMQIKREVEQVESSPSVVPLRKSKLNATSLALSYVSSRAFEKVCSLQDKEDVDSTVIRCLCANGIPLSVLRSPYWDEMVLAISMEAGYRSPSYERAQNILLGIERNRIEREMEDFKQKWPQYGVSILLNGLSDVKQQCLVNITAENQFGSMFLHAYDPNIIQKSQKGISDYLSGAIEKVDPYNVVQLITDNVFECRAAGENVGKLYPFIFWSPCTVHTLRMILKDSFRSLPWLGDTYATAKSIVRFIVHHPEAADIFQNYPRLELLKFATTGCVSHYVTLRLLLDVRDTLRAAVLSDYWGGWTSCPVLDEKVKLNGDTVKVAVMSDEFWEVVHLALSIIKPIYKMIRFVDQEGPLIGEVCERMESMLGEIKDSLKVREDIFMILREKVFTWWSKTDFPLQCLAYALTPKFYDEEYLQLPASGGRQRCNPAQDDDIFDLAIQAICKMVQNVEQSDTVRLQFMSFTEKKGKFSTATAKRDARNPKINVLQWWKFHGGDTKELRDVAFKVLAQPISASSIERPWSTYNYMYNAKRNKPNSSQADDLLYIHSNLRLLSRSSPSYQNGPHKNWDINPDLLSMDGSAVNCEDLCFMGLDCEDPSKQYTFSTNPIQELLRNIEDAPLGNNQSGNESQASTNSVRAGNARGSCRGGAPGKLNPKGKTKRFL